ncbi:hypothetical protein FACS189461_0600 [Spirochaetia bacterium]|nr:hypothetical protein FACS189461_0600 [Spirochaetia bacterium]
MAKLKFQPQPGDVLIANRGLYKHFGIYIGNGRVIHYASNEACNELDPSKAIVHETTISGFMKKSGDIKIRKLADTKSPFTASEVIERARERLGETEYDLARNNCEHLANYCQTEENRSDQIDTVGAVLVGYGKSAVDIFETVLNFRSNWKTDKIGCMKFVGKKTKAQRRTAIKQDTLA